VQRPLLSMPCRRTRAPPQDHSGKLCVREFPSMDGLVRDCCKIVKLQHKNEIVDMWTPHPYLLYFSRPNSVFPQHKGARNPPTHTHRRCRCATLKLGLNSNSELTKQAAGLPKLSKLRYPRIDYPPPTPHEYRKSRSSTLACDPLAHRALHLHGRASSLSFSIRVHVVF